ncbi:Lipopolysaccharide export system protein LptA (LptA) (PDB:2R19) [Commensalibacter communis]|nr:Lipopolysaccharide export system protein LptA (LptA) (PDB:2R19) [Commensalibacter communis]
MKRSLFLTFTSLMGVGLFNLSPVLAQNIDLSHGGQITVTALGGFDWDQNNKSVTAYDQAKAVRGNVTVTADRLVALYRKKAGSDDNTQPKPEENAGQKNGGDITKNDSGSNEIYRLNAYGHVHIYTNTDQAWGDKAVYDIDQATLVLTGKNLKLTTPQNLMTAKDAMEYHSQTRMSVGRGDASVTNLKDGRRITADVLVGYSKPTDEKDPKAKSTPANTPANNNDDMTRSSKLEKVNAFGNVVVRTQTETVRGDRGVYVPDTGIARVVGNVHITRGANQLNGNGAIINMKTGIAHMTESPGRRVQGLVVPNESNNQPK